MDQNWNNQNGVPGGMPAPNMGGQPMAGPQMPQQTMPAPNMNVGTAPIVAQPGVAAIPVQQEKKSSVVEIVILVIVCLIAAGAIVVAVIFFMKWNELKVNHDADIESAKAAVIAEQEELANKKIAEAAKLPNKEWTGPSDYGSISFQYPKNWSVYVAKDGSKGNDYEVYFNPDSLSALGDSESRYALRFVIRDRQYADVTKPYLNKVKTNKMTSQTFSADSESISGMRFEGELGSNMRGTVVIFKVNDKTVILQTDSDANIEDFEKLLLTLRRNAS